MFRPIVTIITELYLYLTKVIFVLKHSVKLHVCCVQCTLHNTHAALRHAATSPNLYNDIILPSVLTLNITLVMYK